MIRRIRQWLCARKGHPHKQAWMPVGQSVGRGDPDVETLFCQGCGAAIERAWTDNAGTEHRSL